MKGFLRVGRKCMLEHLWGGIAREHARAMERAPHALRARERRRRERLSHARRGG